MKAAGPACIVEVPAGGDGLGFKGVFRLAGDLAEVGGEPGADQGFEPGVLPGAENLNLEIPATGRPPLVVGSGAWGNSAGVISRFEYRQAPGLGWQNPLDLDAVLHHNESVAAQPSWRGRAAGRLWRGSTEPVCPAGGDPPCLEPKKPAADMKDGVHQQFARPAAEGAESHVLGVTQQPGGLVVQ